jgi:hypothetical protein
LEKATDVGEPLGRVHAERRAGNVAGVQVAVEVVHELDEREAARLLRSGR